MELELSLLAVKPQLKMNRLLKCKAWIYETKEEKQRNISGHPGKAISDKTPKAQQAGVNINRYVFPSQRTLWSKWNSQMSKKPLDVC